MYRSLPHLIEGWSKNVYLGGRRSYPDEPFLRALLPLAMLMLPAFWLTPPTALAVGLVVDHAGLIGAALAATGLSVLFWALVSKVMRIPPWYGLVYPLGALILSHIFLRSVWRGGRRVEWRGRTYGARAGVPQSV